jgi:hypothetical protein
VSDLGTIPASYRGLVASARRHAGSSQTVIFHTPAGGSAAKGSHRRINGRAGLPARKRVLLATSS